jgi:hypothetical protein
MIFALSEDKLFGFYINHMGKIKNRIGEKHITNEGYEIEIVSYGGKEKCGVLFNNGLLLDNIHYSQIKSGKIKNPYHRSLFNIGYLGVGNYKASKKSVHFKNYVTWTTMLSRCYSEEYQEKYPTYKDVTVCDEWHNFQNFAQWFEESYNPETMEGWHLDKDILVKGNKIYSPETCCFVPSEINHLFSKSNNKRGKYPIGVYKNKLLFQSQISIGGVNKSLNTSNTIEEAFNTYKIAKEGHIKTIAEIWKDSINIRVYEAMINYQVEIID